MKKIVNNAARRISQDTVRTVFGIEHRSVYWQKEPNLKLDCNPPSGSQDSVSVIKT